jgi:hypothetical protein
VMGKETFEIVDEIPQATPGGLDFSKILRYGPLVMKIIATLEEASNQAVGDNTLLGEATIKLKGKEYTWDMGELTRTK